MVSLSRMERSWSHGSHVVTYVSLSLLVFVWLRYGLCFFPHIFPISAYICCRLLVLPRLLTSLMINLRCTSSSHLCLLRAAELPSTTISLILPPLFPCCAVVSLLILLLCTILLSCLASLVSASSIVSHDVARSISRLAPLCSCARVRRICYGLDARASSWLARALQHVSCTLSAFQASSNLQPLLCVCTAQ